MNSNFMKFTGFFRYKRLVYFILLLHLCHGQFDDDNGAGAFGGGVPGVDFPIMSEVPRTDFVCFGGGYYADEVYGCQVFHICTADGRKNTFLCPNGTLFDQLSLVCDWWYNVDCASSALFTSQNEKIGKALVPFREDGDRPAVGDRFSQRPAQDFGTSGDFGVPLPDDRGVVKSFDHPPTTLPPFIPRTRSRFDFTQKPAFEVRTTRVPQTFQTFRPRVTTPRPQAFNVPSAGFGVPLSDDRGHRLSQVDRVTSPPRQRVGVELPRIATRRPQTSRPFRPTVSIRPHQPAVVSKFSPPVTPRVVVHRKPISRNFGRPLPPTNQITRTKLTDSRTRTQAQPVSGRFGRPLPAVKQRPRTQVTSTRSRTQGSRDFGRGRPLPLATPAPVVGRPRLKNVQRISAPGRPIPRTQSIRTSLPTFGSGAAGVPLPPAIQNAQFLGGTRIRTKIGSNQKGTRTQLNFPPATSRPQTARVSLNRGFRTFQTPGRSLPRVNIGRHNIVRQPADRITPPAAIIVSIDDDRFDDGPFDDDRFDDGPFDDDRFDDGPFDDDRFDDGPFDDDRFDDGPFDDDRFDDGPFDDDRFDGTPLDDDRFDDGPFDDDRFDDGPFDDDRFDDGPFDDDRFDGTPFDDDRFDFNDRSDDFDDRRFRFGNPVGFNFGRRARESIKTLTKTQKTAIEPPSEIQLPPPPP